MGEEIRSELVESLKQRILYLESLVRGCALWHDKHDNPKFAQAIRDALKE